jgi:hypothetical protein
MLLRNPRWLFERIIFSLKRNCRGMESQFVPATHLSVKSVKCIRLRLRCRAEGASLAHDLYREAARCTAAENLEAKEATCRAFASVHLSHAKALNVDGKSKDAIRVACRGTHLLLGPKCLLD